jgi:hypothetical protein
MAGKAGEWLNSCATPVDRATKARVQSTVHPRRRNVALHARHAGRIARDSEPVILVAATRCEKLSQLVVEAPAEKVSEELATVRTWKLTVPEQFELSRE